jgi:hypothetical protein
MCPFPQYNNAPIFGTLFERHIIKIQQKSILPIDMGITYRVPLLVYQVRHNGRPMKQHLKN